MKPTIILLHGALGNQNQFKPLQEALKNNFEVYSFNFEGHGDNRGSRPFSMETFSANLLEFMDVSKIEKSNLFGYSMGGYVGLNFAKTNGSKVDKIITLGTKFNWSLDCVATETSKLNPELIVQKVPNFAKSLADIHGEENWKQMVSKTAEMMTELGKGKALKPAEFSQVYNNTLLLLGEFDTMVTMAETELVHIALPNAESNILYDAKHPIESVNTERLAKMIGKFIL